MYDCDLSSQYPLYFTYFDASLNTGIKKMQVSILRIKSQKILLICLCIVDAAVDLA